MSSSFAIKAENIGKRYRLGERRAAYSTLREGLASLVRTPLRHRRRQDTFWALRDVNFTVEPGERLGIIGHNGAGKSTLLKLLSRITRPTEGTIALRGATASLLEVGTGFHPELTGRENIFLNGAILGMSRQETARKFDEIVSFAEVEQFLETPVKRYSSGMYVRLAFSVAAHLQPDILLVDEVLAVGDARFQRKCLGKMEDVSRSQGRTIVFVSHNLQAVGRLCNRAMILERGQVQAHGSTAEVVDEYRARMGGAGERSDGPALERISNDDICLLEATARPNPVAVLDELCLDARFRLEGSGQQELSAFFALTDANRDYVASVYSRDEDTSFRPDQDGILSVRCVFPFHSMLPGTYQLECGLFDRDGQCQYWLDTGRRLTVDRVLFNGRSFDGRGGYATHRGRWSGGSRTGK
ncbi:MAG: ABC transporter ATP-binding protein [Xanthomonadales bacterium]|nr:ABC transporter ATP-binding protein [Xanthomonadales bacterium]